MKKIDYEFIMIDPSSEYWPKQVTNVPALWCAGNLQLLKMPSVSIVGTRHPDEKSRSLTREVVKTLGNQYAIVSGLAEGIDTISHLEALSRGFNTIAVIGTPIDCFYPKENEALQKMIAHRGLLVSQFAIGSKTERYCFMKRNKLMSQVSDFSVVISDSDGGGAVGQAKYTAAQGKKVVVFSDLYFDSSITWTHNISDIVVVSSPNEIISAVKKASICIQPGLFT